MRNDQSPLTAHEKTEPERSDGHKCWEDPTREPVEKEWGLSQSSNAKRQKFPRLSDLPCACCRPRKYNFIVNKQSKNKQIDRGVVTWLFKQKNPQTDQVIMVSRRHIPTPEQESRRLRHALLLSATQRALSRSGKPLIYSCHLLPRFANPVP